MLVFTIVCEILDTARVSEPRGFDAREAPSR
jgi:hypothetical protein